MMEEGNLACEIHRELNITMETAAEKISYLPDCIEEMAEAIYQMLFHSVYSWM